jgi:simple sugar transport system permease protein
MTATASPDTGATGPSPTPGLLARIFGGDAGASRARTVAGPFLSFAAAMLVGAVIVAFEGENPAAVAWAIVRGVFSEPNGVANTLIAASPLLLIGLGLAVAYRAKVFSIGAEGQYVVGATAAVAWATAAGMRELPGFLLIVTAMAVGAAAGALWGAVPAVLRARFGTNVVISSLLLNYIGAAILQWAVRDGIKDPASFVPKSRDVAAARLPLVPGLDVHLGVLITLLLVPVFVVMMRTSRFGYRVDVLGNNAPAHGANEGSIARMTLLVMVLSGACAGLAGFFEVAGVTGRLQSTSGAGYGFTAILIALLGRLRPAGVLLAALGMSGLAIGFEAAQRDYDLPKSLVDVLRALIVVFLVAGDALVARKNAEAAR